MEIMDDEKPIKSIKNSRPITSNKSFFKDVVVLFPCVSINLTKLRISILSKHINENGGVAVSNIIEDDFFISAL